MSDNELEFTREYFLGEYHRWWLIAGDGELTLTQRHRAFNALMLVYQNATALTVFDDVRIDAVRNEWTRRTTLEMAHHEQ